MTIRSDRRVRVLLWSGVAMLSAATAWPGSALLLRKSRPTPIPSADVVAGDGLKAGSSQEIEALARKKMSRTIVKPVMPPPPKVPAPQLDTLVRLSGIIDRGTESLREAFIELRSNGATRAYRAGDTIPEVMARVVTIVDGVVVEYDGRLWKLTDRGVEGQAGDAVSSSGGKP